ncbi:MAG: aminopeptidase [Oscillospiraceae bacterium]|jgi:aminopeptidase|nr:aminopeptidase [Oscillospiraceae bacterium]
MPTAQQREAYAALLISHGVRLQPGQPLVLSASVENYPFARLVAEKAYEAGAREVHLLWGDDEISRLTYLRAADEVFTTFPGWRKQLYEEFDALNAAYLRVESSDPEALKEADPARLRAFSICAQTALKEHSERLMADRLVWGIGAVPSGAWARKVFPGLPEAEAVERLWAAILKASRADGPDPAAAWEAHDAALSRRAARLNQNQFAALRFQNGLGTDLTIPLPDHHIWEGGAATAPDGRSFFPNIPTEEIFTAPHRLGASGHVVSALPLSYQGQLIEGIELTFQDGLVIAHKAAKNQAALENLLGIDEGARRLGEVALVPADSPIAVQKLLYYNTLFDENAACHIALGRAYPNCIKDGVNLSEKERTQRGLNDSLTHVDMMIGTEDLSIRGIRPDGTAEPVFIDGKFAF